LRIVRPGDEEFLASLYSDPVVMEHIHDGPIPPEEGLQHARIDVQMAEHRHFTGMWAVELRGERTVLGWVSLAKLRGVDRDDLQLGYQFSPAYWSHGYATEAMKCLLDYAFDKLGVDRVLALVRPANVRSVRVLKKLGYVHLRKCRDNSSQWCDVYRLTAQKWRRGTR
jgi:ribosomal-protein-alanine N-acetyltransferase